MNDIHKVDKKPEPRVKFKLTQEHNHLGEDCQKGDELELSKLQADKLAKEGKGNIVNY